MTIAGIFIFKNHCPSEEAVLQELDKWVQMFPVFKHRVKGRQWEPCPNFNLKDHFTVSSLPPGSGQRELEEYISRQMSTPFDLSRPLWQAHLLKGYKGSGGAYFVTMHHCISDGQGAVRMVLSLTTSSEEERIAGAGYALRSKPDSSSSPKLSHRGKVEMWCKKYLPFASPILSFLNFFHILAALEFLGILAFLFFLFGLFPNPLASFTALLKWIVFLVTPRKVFKKPGTPEKEISFSESIDLNEVKMVGKATGATVNDVLISNLTSTVRRYLSSTNEISLKKEISCAIPVSLRKPDDWNLGNKVCLTLLNLPMDIQSPTSRLREVKSRLDELKVSREIETSYFGIRTSFYTLPTFILDTISRFLTSKFHVLLTNVPGPKNEIKFAGFPVEDYICFIPQPSTGGLGLCVISYNDKVTLSVNSSKGHIIPNVQQFVKAFKEEFETLKKVVLHNNSPINGVSSSAQNGATKEKDLDKKKEKTREQGGKDQSKKEEKKKKEEELKERKEIQSKQKKGKKDEQEPKEKEENLLKIQQEREGGMEVTAQEEKELEQALREEEEILRWRQEQQEMETKVVEQEEMERLAEEEREEEEKIQEKQQDQIEPEEEPKYPLHEKKKGNKKKKKGH